MISMTIWILLLFWILSLLTLILGLKDFRSQFPRVDIPKTMAWNQSDGISGGFQYFKNACIQGNTIFTDDYPSGVSLTLKSKEIDI